MAPLFRIPALVALLLSLPVVAGAECFVEYKAKRDDPLRLHYGVVRLDADCGAADAVAEAVAQRLRAGGWTLLNVVGMAPDAPGDTKRANAGEFYLRF